MIQFVSIDELKFNLSSTKVISNILKVMILIIYGLIDILISFEFRFVNLILLFINQFAILFVKFEIGAVTAALKTSHLKSILNNFHLLVKTQQLKVFVIIIAAAVIVVCVVEILDRGFMRFYWLVVWCAITPPEAAHP